MKEYINTNGNRFKYNENDICSVHDRKSGNIVSFTADEIMSFIIKTGLWDGYHTPFNIFNIKHWIQFLKMSNHFYEVENRIIRVKDSEGKYRSDFEIALEIRERIDCNKESIRAG